MNKMNKTWLRAGVLSGVSVLVLGACASAPIPSAVPAIASGDAAVEAARTDGATETGSTPLAQARTKLEKAKILLKDGKELEAYRLAEEAQADANLARAQSQTERSAKALNEINASLQVMRDEMERSNANRNAARPATGLSTPAAPAQ